MAGPWENYQAPAEAASGPWSKFAPAAPKDQPGYLSQVGTGLWNTVKGLYNVGAEAGGVAADPLNAVEHLKKLKQMVLDPQIDQAIKAGEKWKAGDRSEAVGHALAAVLPGIGPAAANIGEKLGDRDFTGAAADATVLGATMAAPRVAGAAIDAAPRVAAGAKVAGKVVGTGVKAAAPEVGAALATAGVGELAGHVVPGAEWATRVAAGQLMRSGVSKGLRAGREAMKPAVAEAAAPEVPPVRAPGRIETGPNTSGGPSIAEQLRAEIEAKKAATPEAPVPDGLPTLDEIAQGSGFKKGFASAPPDVQKSIQDTYNRFRRPVETPEPNPVNAQQPPAPAPAVADVPGASTAPAPGPPAATVSQPALETPRSQFNAAGEQKSPQLRAAEMTGANVEKKATRWANALKTEGVTAEDLGNIHLDSDWQKLLDGLRAKGALPAGETIPDQSRTLLIQKLRSMEAAPPPPVEAPPAAGPISQVQQPVAPGSGAPNTAGVQQFPSRSPEMGNGLPGVVPPAQRAAGGGMGAMKNHFVEPEATPVEAPPTYKELRNQARRDLANSPETAARFPRSSEAEYAARELALRPFPEGWPDTKGASVARSKAKLTPKEKPAVETSPIADEIAAHIKQKTDNPLPWAKLVGDHGDAVQAFEKLLNSETPNPAALAAAAAEVDRLAGPMEHELRNRPATLTAQDIAETHGKTVTGDPLPAPAPRGKNPDAMTPEEFRAAHAPEGASTTPAVEAKAPTVSQGKQSLDASVVRNKELIAKSKSKLKPKGNKP